MMPRRTIVVVAAVVVAAVAAILSYAFLNGAQQRAYNNAKLGTAYVVAKSIPRGMTGDDAIAGGYLTQEQIPAQIRPATAITSLDAIRGKDAIATFPAQQVLVSGMFVSPSLAAVTFSQQIPAGDVAITVSVDQVHGVANLVVPGDKVDILVNNNGTETSLLQNVPVIAIGQSIAGQTTAQSAAATTASSVPTSNSGLFTFALPPNDAARVALAQQAGLDIYLLLVPPNNPVVPITPANTGNVFNGPPSP